MKYKTINNVRHSHSRAEYLFNEFCIDKTLTQEAFVESLKTAYYKFDAPLYHLAHRKYLEKPFMKLFKSIPEGGSIVDIGAGTGDSYWLTKYTKYTFKTYYYVEPFQAMINQFSDKNDTAVRIVNDYFESAQCMELFKKDKNQKIFIMSGVLRTLNNIDVFMEALKKNMNKGDVFFLAIEPNNEYFSGFYYKLMPILLFNIRVFRKIKAASLWLVNRSKNTPLDSKNQEIHPLQKSLKFLQNSGIVSDQFTSTMLYGIVNYNNYHSWKNINVPEKFNDGFFTIKQGAQSLDCNIDDLSTHGYLYGVRFPNKLFEKIEGVLQSLFPKKGSTMSAVLIKR